MENKVALALELAIRSAPYQIEKDRYAQAAQEIRRLQQLVDASERHPQLSDASHECQANWYDAASYCEKCGRHLGEGCGKYGPYKLEVKS
jgi:predicted amidophosphoribosyltransferase